jgi:hypothetical protein
MVCERPKITDEVPAVVGSRLMAQTLSALRQIRASRKSKTFLNGASDKALVENAGGVCGKTCRPVLADLFRHMLKLRSALSENHPK